MFFNSFPFLIFFGLVFTGFYVLPPRHRWVLLLAGSYFFYMYWEPEFILLLGFCTALDYTFGRIIERSTDERRRKTLLVTSLTINFGFLFLFKYFNFFNDSIRSLVELAGINYTIPASHLILPVGISFYTFHSVSYIVDIYNRRIPAETHLGKYSLFVAFFPLLVAGPIERANHLLPQLQKNDHSIDFERFISGFAQTAFGFFKKVVVADTLAMYVNTVYAAPDVRSGLTLLIATYMFAIQIYCDFSGYSDIAIGTARMLGYDLFENFRLPYFSKNVTEFWRRWHISLSSWLRDYLYIPLGGSRRGDTIAYRNLFITMLLGGLWHGASWNFVI